MKLSQHADRTEALCGLRAEDIHQWIDGFFDRERFAVYLHSGAREAYDPYLHRKYRHCQEALDDAIRIFEGSYTRDQIKTVFECHIRDDYQGYIPTQEDFENGTFSEKYHEQSTDADLSSILSETELADYFKGAPAGNDASPAVSRKFYWRIVWPTLVAAILFAISSLFIMVPLFRQNMLVQKKQQIRELTRVAASAISFYIHQEQQGVMGREAAQAEAAAEVSQLRYGDDHKDYFWITDLQPVMVMHPYRPDLTGHDLTDYKDHEDKSGKRLFVEFVDLVKADGEGYLAYDWQWKDDPGKVAPKLSYVREIPEWNWIIGTGIYIHDIEEEMARLSFRLIVADAVIVSILLVILGNLLLQSRKIEQERYRAEAGLREAKDRYRALVDASGEGYLLEIEGRTIYSNARLQTMTGYDGHEIADMDVVDLLDPAADVNAFIAGYLRKLYRNDAPSGRYEAVLRTKSGQSLDVELTASRIFLSQKNGHVIVFRPLSRGHADNWLDYHQGVHDVNTEEWDHDGALVAQIERATTYGAVIQVLEQLPRRIRLLTDRGVLPALLRELIGASFDAAVRRFVGLYCDESPVAVNFAFISLGSNARHEMTLFSDQDNALIFDDVDRHRLSDVRSALLQLGDHVCRRLRQAGLHYCPGGIMAANPRNCLSLAEWKHRFDHWIKDASPQSILEVNVFLDIRCVEGDARLVEQLRDHIQQKVKHHPEFLLHDARNCLLYKPPLGLFGHLKGNRQDGRTTVNLKSCIKPFETFARIYALKYDIRVVGTIERLQQLRDRGVIQTPTLNEISYAFDALWRLRFYNQLAADDGRVSDALDLESLTHIERQNLENVIAAIPDFQNRLSFNFLGVAAS